MSDNPHYPRTPRFKGLERVDAIDDLTVTLIRADARKGRARDPQGCVIWCGLMRIPGTALAWVGKGVAYRQVVGEPDRVYRYVHKAKTVAMIGSFDEEPEHVRAAAAWIDGVTITLVAPPPKRQLGTRTGDSGSNTRNGKAASVNRARPLREIGRDQ
ncbi:MAG TPA: hypothetical protein VGF65_11435 [Mycobacterium sp.]|jgi:hypothetical protein